MTQPSQQWIILARILRPQGRRGEVLAELLTDFPNRFAERPDVWLAPPGYTEGPGPASSGAPISAPQPAFILSHWLPVGRNSGRVVLHFRGVDSITAAEAMAGQEVVVPLAERLPLEGDAAYISDLIGCSVYDRGSLLGTIDAVQIPTTADGIRRLEDAAPLLSIATPDEEEILVPFAKAYLQRIDVVARTVHMALPEGLTDLNRNVTPGT